MDTHNDKLAELLGVAQNENGTSSQQARRRVSSLDDVPEVKAYLTRIGAEAKSMLHAAVEEGGPEADYWHAMETGERRKTYKRVIADVVFSRDGEINVTAKGRKVAKDSEFRPSVAEAAAITAAFALVEFPTSFAWDGAIPKHLRAVKDSHLYIFRDKAKAITMIVERIDKERDGKVYIPHSYWSDGQWRTMEPDGLLPLYGAENLSPGCYVMLHEGPKSARAAQKIADDPKHPWHDALKCQVHVGWHGGAPNPHRTDWSLLAGVDEVIIVPDHDEQGRDSVPEISRLLPKRIVARSIRWPEKFPAKFDMANALDKIPKPPEGKPPFDLFEAFESATWATEIIGFKKPVKGVQAPIFGARAVFARQWVYISLEERFVNRRFPLMRMTAAAFEAHHRRFSDVKGIADLTRQRCETFANSTYLPGEEVGATGTGGMAQKFNSYTPGHVRPKRDSMTLGEVTPWLNFLERLFPNAEERLHAQDWLATLIAKPQYRPGHALLMISKAKGTGKGTLVDLIGPLIGPHNVSHPSASLVVDTDFNGWLAFKALVAIAEIYEGHSWKAANRLKSPITDPVFEANLKTEKTLTLPNVAWFIAASNSFACLKLDDDDRRWFIPEITEEKFEQAQAEELRAWFSGGGDRAVLRWAQEYQQLTKRKYLRPGSPPPMTARKKKMAKESLDEDIQNAVEILETIRAYRKNENKNEGEDPDRFVFAIAALRQNAQERIPEKLRLSEKRFSQQMTEQHGVARWEVQKVDKVATRLYSYGKPPATDSSEWKELFVNVNDFAAF